MARLFADENFPLPVVEALRHLNHDVMTLHETGKAGQKLADADVLTFTTEEERILLTLNRKHFILLHAEKPDHAGIIVCTFNPDFEGQAQQIHTVIERQPKMDGQLIRVNRPLK